MDKGCILHVGRRQLTFTMCGLADIYQPPYMRVGQYLLPPLNASQLMVPNIFCIANSVWAHIYYLHWMRVGRWYENYSIPLIASGPIFTTSTECVWAHIYYLRWMCVGQWYEKISILLVACGPIFTIYTECMGPLLYLIVCIVCAHIDYVCY